MKRMFGKGLYWGPPTYGRYHFLPASGQGSNPRATYTSPASEVIAKINKTAISSHYSCHGFQCEL